MIRIHKEAWPTLPVTLAIAWGLWGLVTWLLNLAGIYWGGIVLILPMLVFTWLGFNFFRNPVVGVSAGDSDILSPCDGKVVVIEEVTDEEYFKKPVRQISVFMSPLNVHVNRNPVAGIVRYVKYHPGKYLVAWDPKSSTENERTMVVIEKQGISIGFKQIAGAVARRIRYYVREGQHVQAGEEMGFIKFGSRMDILIPLDCEITCALGDVVKGGTSVLAKMPA